MQLGRLFAAMAGSRESKVIVVGSPLRNEVNSEPRPKDVSMVSAPVYRACMVVDDER